MSVTVDPTTTRLSIAPMPSTPSESLSPGEAMTSFTDFMMTEFPRLNCGCRDGTMALGTWLDKVSLGLPRSDGQGW